MSWVGTPGGSSPSRAPSEPLHMMAQVEAYKTARSIRVREMKELIQKESRELEKREDREREQKKELSRASAVASPGGDIAEKERSLRAREKSLDERRHDELDRLRVLQQKEDALRTKSEEETIRLSEREREVAEMAEKHRKHLLTQERIFSKSTADLDRRAASLDEQEQQLQDTRKIISQREVDLINRGKELELKERALNLKEKELDENISSYASAEKSITERMRSLDERERELKTAEEAFRKTREQKWKTLEDSIHLFESEKAEEKLRVKRLQRECSDRLTAVEKREAEIMIREKEADDMFNQQNRRDIRLTEIEQRAIDRLKRELSERETAMKIKYPDLHTPNRLSSILAHPSPPTNAYSSSHVNYPAQSQSPTELSPDSNIGNPSPMSPQQ
eukprot:TRINITY_DN37463_c0_g1_i1.p1 TRINITY_DN37463_c0_g1~~TRINITY_DN37463_c0_g1_i1.p1  ORF type:complete len:405 (+),score=108.13 TRINITY_DN37463_c0_g1_i1:36-1217(+)